MILTMVSMMVRYTFCVGDMVIPNIYTPTVCVIINANTNPVSMFTPASMADCNLLCIIPYLISKA